MFDSWMEKLMQNAASAYMPGLESKAQARREELAKIKSKVRTEPEKVEEWLDREIEKLAAMNVSEMFKNLRGELV